MKSALFTIRSAQALLVALVVLTFSASCTKKDHDCAQPKPTTTNTGTTRGADFTSNVNNGKTEGGTPGSALRGGVMGTGDDHGQGGISDDGDDQSDNERSHRKPRAN